MRLNLGVSLLALTALAAADAQAVTLKEALASAYETNPDLIAGRAELNAVDERLPQALGEFRPDLRASAGADLSATDSRAGSSDTFNRRLALTATQNLYRGGGDTAGVSLAESQIGRQRASLIALEQTVLENAITAYLDVWEALAVLDLARSNEARLLQQLEATTLRAEFGDRVTQTDVQQSKARYEGARAETRQAEGDLESARAAYRSVIGSEPESLQDPEPLRDLPVNQDEAQSLSAMNPTIRAAEFALEAARHSVDVARSSLLPSVDLEGSLAYDDNDEFTDNRRSASVGLQVTAPLYQGGGEYARVRETRAIVRQRQNEVESAFRTVRESVTRAWETAQTAHERAMSLRAQVEASELALEGVRAEANEGLRTNLDVLDTEQDFFQAQVDLVGAVRDEILATYQLAAATGALTAADLDLDVALFDPQAYFERNRMRLFGVGDSIEE